MNFIGEHLLPGQLGHFFLLLSLVASIGATVSYFLSVQKSSFYNAGNVLKGGGSFSVNPAWRKLARIFFITETISVFAVFVTLFYIISNHLFEYKYAWQHSSLSLEMKYLLSCFWEGQEGSFLLWSVWHCVLGLVIIWREKEWEGPVMTVISFAQFCIATMLLGVSFFGLKSGSNPFILLRNSGVLDNAPVFYGADGLMRQDYLSLIKDGNDLNPLLQNYWMVIHPPVLFLGFASTIVPFAFAIAGLWTKKFGDWTKPALPWALFSAAVLGTGIMMGGRWAYESLNFGGYWAWDPVENASMVPWLTLIGGIHTLLIYKATKRSIIFTFILLLITFNLVLYSTFLTRSGILGDTSVHAFTDLGMNFQLLAFLFVFLVHSFAFYAIRYKSIPHIVKEEQTSSRDFWMFIGSLIFFLTALFITIATSLPVINSIIPHIPILKNYVTGNLSMGEDAVFSYNRVIIFVAIIIGILTA